MCVYSQLLMFVQVCVYTNETSRGPRQRKNLGTLPMSVCKNVISNWSANTLRQWGQSRCACT